MITGVNHITLAVRDLSESFTFYTEVLGLRARLSWNRGAYVSEGSLWLALRLDDQGRACGPTSSSLTDGGRAPR